MLKSALRPSHSQPSSPSKLRNSLDLTKSLQVETCHKDVIHDAKMNFMGTMLATASSDKTVRIFEVDMKSGSREHVAKLEGHTQPVWSVSWAHPMFGKVLASCSYDGAVIVWKECEDFAPSFINVKPLLLSPNKSRVVKTLRRWDKPIVFDFHKSSMNSVQWSPPEYGMILACGNSDSRISILTITDLDHEPRWEYTTINDAHKLGCNSVSWCPVKSISDVFDDGPAVVKRFVSAGNDCSLKIWRQDERSEQWCEEDVLNGHHDWVRDVAWSPTLTRIASVSADQRVIVWNFQQGDKKWLPETVNVFEDTVWSASWSCYSGEMLVISEGQNTITLWKKGNSGNWCFVDTTEQAGPDRKVVRIVTPRRKGIIKFSLSKEV